MRTCAHTCAYKYVLRMYILIYVCTGMYMCLQIGGCRCEDVSGATGPSTMGRGISEVSFVRKSEAKSGLNTSVKGHPEIQRCEKSRAKVAQPPRCRVPPESDLRDGLRRKWREHLSSGRFGPQICKNVSGEDGGTTTGQGTSEVGVVSKSRAKRI